MFACLPKIYASLGWDSDRDFGDDRCSEVRMFVLHGFARLLSMKDRLVQTVNRRKLSCFISESKLITFLNPGIIILFSAFPLQPLLYFEVSVPGFISKAS